MTLKYSDLWAGAGGIFVHHSSAETTIEELRRLVLEDVGIVAGYAVTYSARLDEELTPIENPMPQSEYGHVLSRQRRQTKLLRLCSFSVRTSHAQGRRE